MATWDVFFLASLVGVILLYLVGYLVLKGFNFSTLFSLAAAPIASTLCFEAFAVVYDKANIFATGLNIFLPGLVLALIVFGVGIIWRKKRTRSLASARSTFGGSALPSEAFDPKLLVLYVGLGLAVGLVVFVKALDGTECFNETYDNITHLGLLRSFVESGHYSTFSVSLYRDMGAAGSYYPAGWHMITAMVSSLLGVSHMLSTNAMNYVCCCVVYPISCLCLLTAIFKDRKDVLIAGAFASIAFITFPWFFVVYGVLESNLFGFIMVPVMLVSVMRLFSKDASRIDRIRYLLFAIFSVVFCFVAQPNAAFAVLLFAIPYFAGRIWEITSEGGKHPLSLVKRLGVEIVFLFVMALIWYGCYKLPFLYDVVQFIWPPAASKAQGAINTLLFSNSWSPAAFVVAFLVAMGLLYMLKIKRFGWIALALGMAALVYWIGVGFEGRIDQIATGFWYSDWRRTAALQAMIAVPVAALGMVYLYELLPKYLKSNALLKIALCIVLLVALFIPTFKVRGMGEVRTPFGYFADMMDEYYSMDQTDDEIIFSQSEREFAEEVAQIVGDDIVYNIPYDGSFLAYQVNGVRTVYRLPYTGAGQNSDQKTLQARLSEYTTDVEAAQALENVGAKYVMLLDAGHIPYHRTWPDYYPENWEGITNINEDTPGFELVLSEGDMRLYKIEE